MWCFYAYSDSNHRFMSAPQIRITKSSEFHTPVDKSLRKIKTQVTNFVLNNSYCKR